jgi:hypothetical protein
VTSKATARAATFSRMAMSAQSAASCSDYLPVMISAEFGPVAGPAVQPAPVCAGLSYPFNCAKGPAMDKLQLPAEVDAVPEKYGAWLSDYPQFHGIWTDANRNFSHTPLKRIAQTVAT